MKSKVYILCVVLFLAGAAIVTRGVLHAQQQQPHPPSDPIGDNLFPPELIMQNQEAINLTEEQKSSLKTELRQAQTKFTELQWQMEDQAEKMAALLKQPRPDEQQVLAQLDKVLNAEREIKREQISLLIRIKIKLTAEQQSQLMAIRNRGR
jgi:Spy/CpxP family protein refolding chaperone